jgi:hypothetical protein
LVVALYSRTEGYYILTNLFSFISNEIDFDFELELLHVYRTPHPRLIYSLRSILLFANTDVSRHILVVLAKSNMGWREY